MRRFETLENRKMLSCDGLFPIDCVTRIRGGGWNATAGDVAILGDVNGDLVDDFAISMPHIPNDGPRVRTHIFFGGKPLPEEINLTNLEGVDVSINGRSDILLGDDGFAVLVESAGDVNGDGINDLLIGVTLVEKRRAAAYLIYGSETLPQEIELRDLADTGFGVSFFGIEQSTRVGFSRAGDVNGDGFEDMLFGTPWFETETGSEKAGQAYLVYGSESLPSSIELLNLNELGVTIVGPDEERTELGAYVSQAGDVDDDGFGDILISAQGSKLEGNATGQVFLIYGSAELPPTIDATELDDIGTSIWKSRTSFPDVGPVASAGDFNGDGIDDYAIGAPGGHPASEVFIMFGNTERTDSIDLSDLGNRGVEIFGRSNSYRTGWPVATVGDLNDDGKDDLLIGSPAESIDPEHTFAGIAAVVYGTESLSDISILELGDDGVLFESPGTNEEFGSYVTGGGDIDGDGIGDFLISAPRASRGLGGEGETYLFSGRSLRGEPLFGDLNLDGLVDALDIDQWYAHQRENGTDVRFDLNADNQIDDSDVDFLVRNILNIEFGDTDLNGTVDFADFLVLSQNFALEGGWAEGDFDGNGKVEFGDFLLLAQSFGTR